MTQGSESIVEELQAVLDEIEHDRLKALRDLIQIQALSQSLFEAEAKRLAEKLGSDHPRPKAIKVEFSHGTLAAQDFTLCTHVDTARISIFAPEEGGWIVAGWVTDLRGQGIESLVVSIYDKDRYRDDELGSVRTDAEGFFGIRFDPERLPDPPDLRPEVWLEVIDETSGNRLYTSPEPFRCNTRVIELLCIRSAERSEGH